MQMSLFWSCLSYLFPIHFYSTRLIWRNPILRATKFAANDWWAEFYGSLRRSEGQSQSLAVLTGASTGATEALVVVPFELVKIRLQDPKSALKYKGVVNCASQIVRESGPLGLYRGFESTVWRHIVWNASYFGCIFKVRSLIVQSGSSEGGILGDFLAGSIGGTVATVMNTPLDVVKSRIQGIVPDGGQKAKTPWVWIAVYNVYKAEGFGALYKGLVPKVVRFAPGGGMMLVIYTSVIDLLSR
ncbi:mitochondrial 2-oxodicarboxylate carrier 1 [Fusarium langsethiae]|uniref:Mitochondrial 2-oxodicarboxylate carrier 1 n=1 Tax=Fusarium langsethiae TaxID=179993 RepID=A0A0N0V5T5_FUSLA|nr:mitochondrial 2-oxodicarboxylate carrier 1 [Fusarium langsethiae]GKU05532.1 unnamed protein product [Fusarium langsethiae]